MTIEIFVTLSIMVMAIFLFATEKLRSDVVALLVLIMVIVFRLVSPDEAFSGFANPAVITVWAVYIISGALFKTGIADIMGTQILRIAGDSETRLIAVIMLVCGVMSAFMNNIGATAVLLPAVIGISRQTNIPVTKLLIPLAFSSLLGGNMTLIGTPPNILASSILVEKGQAGFAFFDFLPFGIVVFATGILFMVFVGRFVLPKRDQKDKLDSFHLREYVSEIRVLEESPLVGQKIGVSVLEERYSTTILARISGEKIQKYRLEGEVIHAGDLLLVEGSVNDIIKFKDEIKIILEAERVTKDSDVDLDDSHIIEATISPRSRMQGKTLKKLHFVERFGLAVLAMRRHSRVLVSRILHVKIQFGDTLLLRGTSEKILRLKEIFHNDFLILEPVKVNALRRNKMYIALSILGFVLLLTTYLEIEVAVAMVLGSLLMVTTRCITMDEAYESIEWKSVFLIAGMLPLSIAMQNTGTAEYLAQLMVRFLGDSNPMLLLGGVYLITTLVTQPMSNAAAAVLFVPIAIDIAEKLSVNPHTFVMATVIAASTSFVTPFGHQSNVLVYGVGGYKFMDFVKVGSLLTLVLFVVTLVFLPMFWPL